MSTDGWSPAQRQRFGELADRTRKAAKLSTNRVLPSRETWLRVARGDVVSGGTLRNLEEAFGWEPLSADDFPAGTGPRPATPPASPLPADIEAAAYITEAGQLLGGIAGNTRAEREEVLRLLRLGHERTRTRDDRA